MKVAVVTPRFREPSDWLARCLASVRSQTYPCTHILVNDGGDRELPPSADTTKLQTIELPLPHGDYGDTPRAIGSVSAIAQGFDALLWLDADNWFLPEHVASLVEKHAETGAAIVTSSRTLHHVDGRTLGVCPEIDPKTFVDTNCYLVTRAAFGLIPTWFLMPPEAHTYGDRVVFAQMKRSGLYHCHTDLATVAYRTLFRAHYDFFGVPPPPNAKDSVQI